MTPQDMAAACTRMMCEATEAPDRPWSAADDSRLTIYQAATTGRADQVCIAAWLPWEWEKLSLADMMTQFLVPLTKRLLNKIPTDLPPADGELELPVGVEAGRHEMGRFMVRVTIAPNPISKHTGGGRLAGARFEPWYNIDRDRMEHQSVLPLLRIDVRVKQKELTS